MRFWSGISTESNTHLAVKLLASEALQQLGGPPDLSVVFISPHHRKASPDISASLKEMLGSKILLGCTGEGIIGTSVEIEQQPAISLWVADLPDVTLIPFHLSFEESPKGVRLKGWPKHLPQIEDQPFFIVLAEPFSTPADDLLAFVQKKFPFAPVLGGMASGARIPGENILFLDNSVLREGVVGLVVHGPIRIETVVSQGCRPIGERYVITAAERNIIHELGGRRALQHLTEAYEKLSEEEKQLARHGLHVGTAIEEQKSSFGRGDFLVRSLTGIDENRGSLTIGDMVKVGQTVQFHVRDAASAKEDLHLLLEARKRELGEVKAEAALLFSCNGRGRRFFGTPHQDAESIRERLGEIPVAGFFAQGEIGPIGRKNFLHGFTASIGLFCKPKS